MKYTREDVIPVLNAIDNVLDAIALVNDAQYYGPHDLPRARLSAMTPGAATIRNFTTRLISFRGSRRSERERTGTLEAFRRIHRIGGWNTDERQNQIAAPQADQNLFAE